MMMAARVRSNRGVDQVVLAKGIVFMGIDTNTIPKCDRAFRSGFAFCFEERIVLGRDEDGDERLPQVGTIACSRCQQAQPGKHGKKRTEAHQTPASAFERRRNGSSRAWSFS